MKVAAPAKRRTVSDYRRARAALHTLWTSAVGRRDYQKQLWLELAESIEDLARRAGRRKQ